MRGTFLLKGESTVLERIGTGTAHFKSNEDFERYVSVVTAAQIIGTSVMTVRRLMQTRQLEYQRVSPRRIVIRPSALQAYLERVTVLAES